MNQKGGATVVVIIALLVIVGGVVAYVTYTRTATAKEVDTASAPDNRNTATADNCNAERDNILKTVIAFERAQMEKNSNTVLPMFTKAVASTDAAIQAKLQGELYASPPSNFTQNVYRVTKYPTKSASREGCIVVVEEQRNYPGGVGPYPSAPKGQFDPATPYLVTFQMVQIGNEWKVENYLSRYSKGVEIIEGSGKFSGWGY